MAVPFNIDNLGGAAGERLDDAEADIVALDARVDALEAGEGGVVNVLTPEQYGAVGDGVVDDAVALQAWFDAAAEVSTDLLTGTVLKATPGKSYKFSQPLSFLPANSNGRFSLEAYGTRFVYTGPAGASVTVTVTFDVDNLTITRSSGSWVADGIGEEESWIEVRGSASNDGPYRVQSRSTTVLTVYPGAVLTVMTEDEGPVSVTVDAPQAALQIGSGSPAKKWFYSQIRGFWLAAATQKAVCSGLKIVNSDFMTIHDCVLGSFDRPLYCPGFREDGGSNSLSMYDVNIIGGGRTGAEIYGVNVFQWRGGKVQQSEYGIIGYGGGVWTIEAIDFSLISVSPILFERNEKVRLQVYTESLGSDVEDNDDKIIHLIDCNGIDISGNLSCATADQKTNIGHAVYLENCYGVRFSGQVYSPGKSAMYLDADCGSGNVFAYEAIVDNNEDLTPARASVPIIDLSGRLINQGYGKMRRPLPAALTNYATEPLATLTLTGDVAQNGTTPNEDEDDTVPVWEFNTAGGGNHVSGLSDTTVGATGKTLYLRIKMKAIEFLEPLVDREFNKARVEVTIIDPDAMSFTKQDIFRIGFDWDWYELVYPVPDTDAEWEYRIAARSSGDLISIAIDEIELLVY